MPDNSRQECAVCGEYTGRCEDDSLYFERDGLEAGPLCESCYDEVNEAEQNHKEVPDAE